MKRQWILWLASIAFVWYIFQRFTEIKTLVFVLSQGKWHWVVLAFLLEVIFFLLYSLLYHKTFESVGIKNKFRAMAPVVLASVFVNTIAPSAGLSAIALFVDDARKRGHNSGKTSAAAILVWIFHYGVFAFFLLAGLVYLSSTGRIQAYEIAAAALLYIFLILLATATFLPPKSSGKMLRWLVSEANYLSGRFRRKLIFDSGWVDRYQANFSLATTNLKASPLYIAALITIAAAMHLFNIAVLAALFAAFYHPVSAGFILAAYSIIFLFWIIAPTPSGVGVVEGVGTLFLVSLAIPAEAAAVIILSFRGLSFWLPLLIGFVCLRRVSGVVKNDRK